MDERAIERKLQALDKKIDTIDDDHLEIIGNLKQRDIKRMEKEIKDLERKVERLEKK